MARWVLQGENGMEREGHSGEGGTNPKGEGRGFKDCINCVQSLKKDYNIYLDCETYISYCGIINSF